MEQELSDGEVLSLIDQVSDMGVPAVTFSGGEPMMRSGLLHFVSRARAKSLAVTLLTTGSLVTAETAACLAQEQVRVKVSLDGVTPETHDSLRSQGAFAAALRGIRLLQSADIRDLVVQYSVHRENMQEISRLPEFLKSIGVRNLVVGLVKPAGRAWAGRSRTPHFSSRRRWRPKPGR